MTKSKKTEGSKNTEMPAVHSVRTYQAVTFNKSSETFFSTERINLRSACEIKLHTDLAAVEINDGRDHILVPFTNISAIYLMSPIKIKNQKDRDAEASRLKKNDESKVDTASRPM